MCVLRFSQFLPIRHLNSMDLDVQTVLQWLIIGVIVLIGLSLLGVLINVAGSILGLLLKGGVIILVVLIIIRVLEGLRD